MQGLQPQRTERYDRYARTLEGDAVFRGESLRAECIVEHIDAHAGRRTISEKPQQRFGQVAAVLVIQLKRNRLRCRAQVVPQPLERAISVQRHVDAVPRQERGAGEHGDGERKLRLCWRNR